MNTYRLIILISLIVAMLSQIGGAVLYYGRKLLNGLGLQDGGIGTAGNTTLVVLFDSVSIAVICTANGSATTPPMWTPALVASLSMVTAGTTITDYVTLRKRGASQSPRTLLLLSLVGRASVLITSLLAIIIPITQK